MYDINKDGSITADEMLEIIQSLYQMVHDTVKFPEHENIPEKWVANIFQSIDKDMNRKISLEEFIEGGKVDSEILNVCQLIPIVYAYLTTI